jgi:hypothetical protein
MEKRFDQVDARLGLLEQRTFDLASRLPIPTRAAD